jgi:hypothetical protein
MSRAARRIERARRRQIWHALDIAGRLSCGPDPLRLRRFWLDERGAPTPHPTLWRRGYELAVALPPGRLP